MFCATLIVNVALQKYSQFLYLTSLGFGPYICIEASFRMKKLKFCAKDKIIPHAHKYLLQGKQLGRLQ